MNNTPTIKMESIIPARPGSLGIAPLAELPPDLIAASLVWTREGAELHADSVLGPVVIRTYAFQGEPMFDDIELDGIELAGGSLYFEIKESAEHFLELCAGDIAAVLRRDGEEAAL